MFDFKPMQDIVLTAFGEDVLLLPANRKITGIYNVEVQAVAGGINNVVMQTIHTIKCRDIDVVGVTSEDRIKIRDKTFRAIQIIPQFDGFTTIVIEQEDE